MSRSAKPRTPDHITKRDGRVVPYEGEKILNAMSKAFAQEHVTIEPDAKEKLLADVEQQLDGRTDVTVEDIQDIVERTLMTAGYYDVAKTYILYRERQSKRREVRRELLEHFEDPEVSETLKELLESVETDFPDSAYDLSALLRKFKSFYKDDSTLEELFGMLLRSAVELTDQDAPKWEQIAGRLYGLRYKYRLRRTWATFDWASVDLPEPQTPREPNFYEKLRAMHALGLYGDHVLDNYSREEILEAADWMDEDRDKLLNVSGYDLLIGRYIVRTGQHVPLESIQEMFLGIALFLASAEATSEIRMTQAKAFYDMLSQLKVTMATPTLANARKTHHQLSSCFIDTVPDDLQGIYRSISNFANVSKFGGGMGLYFGKVRARGSSIRGFEGAAGGVIRWIRLANDTAVAVDQLGVRQGAVAVYLDVWHKDLPEFLNLRTNNGDDRMKAHDVFPGVCYPDYFWRQVEENMDGDWALLCPHDVLTKKGYALEDYYGEEWERRYLECVEDPAISKRWIPVKELVRLIIHSMIETGTPFTFNRDAVNRANPNKHEGVIYCSNLCTEIAQNMSPASEVEESIETEDGETVIVSRVKPGNYVVCNLASLNLGRINVRDEEELGGIVRHVVRALDNVIQLNNLPVPDGEVTNQRYRAIGLGVSGYHHMLANERIAWESEEHLKLVDEVFETINYHAICASHDLAKEKGAYPLFKGSDWQTGAYFEDRHYTSERWQALKAAVAEDGLRNGYLLAIAPTASTSIVSGTTAGIDPIMERFYYDEKKSGLIPRVAPDLEPENYWLYKSAYHIDQSWSIRANGIRTRHIDQASSMNLYVTLDYTFRDILNLYLEAYREGVKTVYYVRSKSLEVEDCDSCSS